MLLKQKLGVLLCFLSFVSFGQFEYKPLKSVGPVPEDFSLSLEKKYSREQRKLKGENAVTNQKEEKNFYLQSEYFVDRILQNGSVIYGDTVTQYLNGILDILLENDPELRSEIRIYTVKSSVFNAYTTNNGIIFVNLGLISQLENEAQLASVIAHEIIHYKENHVKEGFLEEIRVQKEESGLSRKKKSKKIHNYNKEQELEADELGYHDIYKNSGYRRDAFIDMFDVTIYSYLPFNEIPFDVSFLENDFYKVPSAYRLEKVNDITAIEDYDDTDHTHPNIKKRKDAILDIIEDGEEGEYYQLGKETFTYIRELSRFETTRLFLIDGNPGRALYDLFLLSNKYPNHPYLEKLKAHAIYMVSVYANYYKLDEILPDYEKIEGESQQLFHILSKMNEEELNSLAVYFSYENKKRFPEDKVVSDVFEDAVWELTHFHELEPKNYRENPPEDNAQDSIPSPEKVEEKEGRDKNSKVARLRKKKSSQLDESKNWKYAFVELLKDEEFIKAWEEQSEKFQDWQKTFPTDEDGDYVTLKDIRNPKSDLNRSPYLYTFPKKKENLGGQGVKKALVVTPQYLRVDEFKSMPLMFEETEEGRKELNRRLKDVAKKGNLDFELYDYKTLPKKSLANADMFNEIQLLQGWISEKMSHSDVSLVQATSYDIQEILEQHEVSHVIYTGAMNYRSRYYGYQSISYFFLFDFEEGNTLYKNVSVTKKKEKDYVMKANLYNDILHVTEPKKMK